MENFDSTAVKRSVLLGARIRFSPSGASVRSQAIECIIEQNLASADEIKGLTENQLQDLVTLESKTAVLRPADVREGLQSLKRSGRVIEVPDGKKRLYLLSQDAKNEVKQIIAESEYRTNATIRELFGSASGGDVKYSRAFLRLLCSVFSKLSEVYVQSITLKQTPGSLVEHQFLTTAISETLSCEPIPDPEAFRYGVNRFFRESSPQFDRIKWNMAQNFYVTKALGIDSVSDLLSIDAFKNAILYCDTNVLIAGLMPENRHHNSLLELSKSCQGIGMTLKATHATVEELHGVITAHSKLLQKVIGLIPDGIIQRVRNFLLEAYLAERQILPHLSLDEFLSRFQAPLDTLQSSFGITVQDDIWFLDASEKQATKDLAKRLSKQYQQARGRPKAERAAIHDAVLLSWVKLENKFDQRSWVVTLDLSLVQWNAENPNEVFNVVTLDAFLQWMSPLAVESADDNKLAEIFSQAIRYQLLPRETFFSLRDFQVFAEMGIETKQIPSEDVEACIREVKQIVPRLDPSKAEDREKIGQVIQRYFADPGTKYRQTIDELQKKTDELNNKLSEEAQLRRELEHKLQQRKLVNSALLRGLISLGLLFVVESAIVILVWKYGNGQNLFQKITDSWPWLVLGFGIIAIAFPFIMGRERIRLLKWWKGDIDDGEPSK